MIRLSHPSHENPQSSGRVETEHHWVPLARSEVGLAHHAKRWLSPVTTDQHRPPTLRPVTRSTFRYHLNNGSAQQFPQVLDIFGTRQGRGTALLNVGVTY